jgi:hypothetical protein
MLRAAASVAEVGLCPAAMRWGDEKKQYMDDFKHIFTGTKALQ